jgi:hypothetical protein
MNDFSTVTRNTAIRGRGIHNDQGVVTPERFRQRHWEPPRRLLQLLKSVRSELLFPVPPLRITVARSRNYSSPRLSPGLRRKTLCEALCASSRYMNPRLDLCDNLTYFDTVKGDRIGPGSALSHLSGRSSGLLALEDDEGQPMPILGSHPITGNHPRRLLHPRENVRLEVLQRLVLVAGLDTHPANNRVHGAPLLSLSAPPSPNLDQTSTFGQTTFGQRFFYEPVKEGGMK